MIGILSNKARKHEPRRPTKSRETHHLRATDKMMVIRRGAHDASDRTSIIIEAYQLSYSRHRDVAGGQLIYHR